MGRLLIPVSTLILAMLAGTVYSRDFELAVDMRAVSTDSDRSYLYGGGGKLRFDEQHDGLRLGSVYLGYRGDLTDTVHFDVDAFAYGDHDVNPIDFTELYVSWRPVPDSLWRSEFKLGAFYPAISMENRMRGWRSPYSISSSAINTWVGEELRTLGLEYNFDWLGQQGGRNLNLGFTAAAYGWNDSAGVVIAMRGWALHDRQTTLFGRVGKPGDGIVAGRTLFYDDIDRRAGYYVGMKANYRGALEARVLHYDNRANPAIEAPAINDYAWKISFNSFGLRWTPDDTWTAIWQRLYGRTFAVEEEPATGWEFDSNFVLLSWKRAAHRLTARYDDFDMHQMASDYGAPNFDRGHAITAAYSYDFDAHWNAALEAMRVSSVLYSRIWIGAPTAAVEKQLQLALRYTF